MLKGAKTRSTVTKITYQTYGSEAWSFLNVKSILKFQTTNKTFISYLGMAKKRLPRNTTENVTKTFHFDYFTMLRLGQLLCCDVFSQNTTSFREISPILSIIILWILLQVLVFPIASQNLFRSWNQQVLNCVKNS